MINKTIGLIGAGNMGSAIIDGLLQKGLVDRKQIFVWEKLKERLIVFCRTAKLAEASSAADLVKKVDVILLAVKPQDLESAVKEFASELKPNQILISILAGTPLAKIQKFAGTKVRLVRAMPNLGAIVGAAITALTGNDSEALKVADSIFLGCGETVVLAEDKFDLVTAISGSGPAYFFLLMELLVKEGVRNGLERDQARKLAAETAYGAALLARGSKDEPAVLREKVASKGGTTEAALKVFFEKGFPEIVSKAVDAARNRGKELSR